MLRICLRLLIVLLVSGGIASAQNVSQTFWNKQSEALKTSERAWYPRSYQNFSLDLDALKNFLSSAPFEKSPANHSSSFIIELPIPDGNFHRFTLVESPIMESALAVKYPFIRTYAGQGIDDASATIRCDITQFGFHGYILSSNGTIYIDPVSLNDAKNYIIYYKKDIPAELNYFNCLVPEESKKNYKQAENISAVLDGQLRTYRLALAADYEYSQYYGGTVGGAMSGITTTLNRVNGIYEKELDIHLNLIGNDDVLIYAASNGYTSTNDPYTNGVPSSLLFENQNNIDATIGAANYDVGHVFTTAGGGLSFINAACNDGSKAESETGLSHPQYDAFDVDYAAHEIGHEFGAFHPYNSISGYCNGQRHDASAYEPGSGSTIMAYAGICSSDNLQPHSDAYFHSQSFDEIVSYTQTSLGNTCPVITNGGNNSPAVSVPSDYYIPISTPFKLTASGSDPDGEPITYCWEEWDLGPADTWNNPSGNAPIFRSFSPVTSGTRIFPQLINILGDSVTIGEIMPSYARDLHFRCTVRDNRSGCGGVSHSASTTTVHVVNAAGVGFAITNPNNAGLVWDKHKQHTVFWEVAGTKDATIGADSVNIYMSTDNGYTFPYFIATAENIGAYAFTLPAQFTDASDTMHWDSVRVMVEGAGKIFFDINNHSFRIDNYDILQPLDSTTDLTFYPTLLSHDSYNDYSVHFTILSPSSKITPYTVRIFDIAGKLMGQYSYEKKYEKDQRSIDVSSLASGMYFARFDLSDVTLIRKFVKTRYK